MSRYSQKEYDFWLAVLRTGHDRFVAEQELESPEEDRKLVAVNILIAYTHLVGEESPYKGDLTEDDMRTVSIARGINDQSAGGRPS